MQIPVDTAVPRRVLEIEGEAYPVAPRTSENERRLRAATGEGEALMLARLQVLLGGDACRRLFISGDAEDLDRMAAICDAALSAWREADTRRLRSAAREVATALSPVNELLRRLAALNAGAAEAPLIRLKGDGA